MNARRRFPEAVERPYSRSPTSSRTAVLQPTAPSGRPGICEASRRSFLITLSLRLRSAGSRHAPRQRIADVLVEISHFCEAETRLVDDEVRPERRGDRQFLDDEPQPFCGRVEPHVSGAALA